jgi:hypothetical protein
MCDICDGTATQLGTLEAIEDRLHDRGWFAIGVEGAPDSRPWSYTIGMNQTFDAPELVMVGACDHCAKQAFDELIDGGVATTWGRGHPPETWARGQRIAVVPVHPTQWATERFNLWLEHRRFFPHDAPKRAVQLLFADEAGLLPTEPGVDLAVKRCQTRLDRPVVPNREPARGRARRRRRR